MKIHHSMLVISLCLIIFLITGCGLFGITIPGYCTLSSFEGKVIDAETKQPIQGVVILAVYYGSVSSVAGSMSYEVDAQETLTAPNGDFKLPEVKYWSKENPGKPRGRLIIFKPGYGTLSHKKSRAVGENKSWPPPGKYIVYEIPKLNTRKERVSNIRFSRPEIHSSKMKNFIQLLNEEYINMGYQPFKITDEER